MSVIAVTLILTACSSMEPLEVAPEVDLDRFMGDWYVIANIPTAIERGAHNAVESYRQESNGTIATTFTFRDEGFGGKRKEYHPRGFISEESNAIWGMQFVWPFKADYRIAYLDEEYTVTIIGRNKRDYVWLMARQPELSAARYEEFVNLIATMGYDTSKLQKVPQKW
jgi:apolipoprotein D and lipocalin family protein